MINLQHIGMGFLFIFVNLLNGWFIITSLFWLADAFHGMTAGILLFLLTAEFPIAIFLAIVYGVSILASKYVSHYGLFQNEN